MTPFPIAAISARINSIESRFRPPGVENLRSTAPTASTGSANNGASFSDAYSAAVAVPWSQIPGARPSVIGPAGTAGSAVSWTAVGAMGPTGSTTPGPVPTGPAGQTSESLDSRSVAVGTPYAELFDAAGQRHGVPPRLLASIGWVESRYNPNALSPDGAQGVMQLMPFVSEKYRVDPHIPAQAIDAAAQLLSEHHDRFGNWELSVASYFSGAGAVSRAGNQPPTSRSHGYVRSVTERLPYV